MSLNRDAVMQALASVADPNLQKPVVELGLVKDIVVDGGHVGVLVGVPVARSSLASELEQRVRAALESIGEIHELRVDIAVLSDEEISELREKLVPRDTQVSRETQAAADQHGHDTRQGRNAVTDNPFSKPGSSTRILGITSGKGGVGKSSVTVNLALALAALGRDIAIIDADVYGFSVPKMLGITEDPMVIDDLIIPPVAHGVRCISIGFFVEEDQPVMWRGPMLHKALEQFLVDVYWGEPDYLLIDMPPGTGDIAISMAQYLPRSETFVVTTPQSAAQRVAQRTAFMAKKLNLPLAGVIENMSWFTGDDGKRYEIFGSGGGAELAEKLEVPLIGQVPLVPELRVGGDIGLPVVVSAPDGEAAAAFASIAQTIDSSTKKRVYRRELSIRA